MLLYLYSYQKIRALKHIKNIDFLSEEQRGISELYQRIAPEVQVITQ